MCKNVLECVEMCWNVQNYVKMCKKAYKGTKWLAMAKNSKNSEFRQNTSLFVQNW